MKTISVTTPTVDRQAIRAELEKTRAAFHALLAQIPGDDWERPTSNPVWNQQTTSELRLPIPFPSFCQKSNHYHARANSTAALA